MTERTQEWAERVGREAVELGMPYWGRMGWVDDGGSGFLEGDSDASFE